MKKILLLTSYMSGHGGVERVIERMYPLESDLNVRFTTLSLTDGVFETPEKKTFLSIKNKKWIPEGRGKYIKLNLKNKYLNILFHSIYVFIYLLFNRYDGVIATGPMQSYYLNKIRKITAGKFFIYAWPHFSVSSGFGDFNKFKYADKVLGISKGICSQLKDMGMDERKIIYFPNPFDEKEIVISPVGEIKRFIYIGRFQFEGQKNLKELIDSCSLISEDFEVVLIGDGEDFDVIKDYINKKNISEKFIFQREWTDNPWDLSFKPTALLLTSAFEGLPTVLGEAISRGIPCISSDCETGPKDFIIEGVNGYLYPCGDICSLAEKMKIFINDENLFSPGKIQESMRALYIDSYKKRFRKIME